MPVKYAVKRNALSSKWCVWATDTDSSSPVENLIAEFKKSEDAESYHTRVEAGETHDDIIASLSAKKPKVKGNGGVFGKLLKRGSDEAASIPEAAPVVHNPVIEIPAPVRRGEEAATPVIDESPAVAKPARAAEARSRFEFIEQQPAPPPPPLVKAVKPTAPVEEIPVIEDVAVVMEPAVEPQPEVKAETLPETLMETASPVEAQAEPVETQPAALSVEQTEIPEPVLTGADTTPEITPEPVEANHAATPRLVEKVSEQPVIEEISAAEVSQQDEARIAPVVPATSRARATAPVTGVPAQQNQAEQQSRLVDWTFTPPPDVTPEELRSSGAVVPVTPAASKRVEDDNRIDPEWAGPAIKSMPAAVDAHKRDALSQDPDTGRVTVEICVSKALRDSTNGDSRISDKKYNSIASKEYTEVSKAFAAGNSTDNLREELTHLAAVCLAWADAIKKRQSSGSEARAA